MPSFLQNSFASDTDISSTTALVRLATALAFGCAVALIYRWTRGSASDRRFIATLVLLTLLLSVTTIVIGDNIARAFSIVGALSIVRFRTVVEDTRDTAFVICAVALGLAVGAGYFIVPAMALPFIAFAAKMFSGHFGVANGSALLPFSLHVKVAPDFAGLERLQKEIARPAAARRRERTRGQRRRAELRGRAFGRGGRRCADQAAFRDRGRAVGRGASNRKVTADQAFFQPVGFTSSANEPSDMRSTSA